MFELKKKTHRMIQASNVDALSFSVELELESEMGLEIQFGIGDRRRLFIRCDRW